MDEKIAQIILSYYPDTQAIYIFGSYNTEYFSGDSDIDIAVLLPVETAKEIKSFVFTECYLSLRNILMKDIDLINIRDVSTVFQKEIINSGKIIYIGDNNALLEFEMLTISFYQKINEERKDILQNFYLTKRAYNV